MTSPIRPPHHFPWLASEAHALAEVGADFHRRGWMLGTSGSLSVRASDPDEPLNLFITVSGKDKGDLGGDDFLCVEDDGEIFQHLGDPKASSEALFRGDKRPSGEVLVHRAIYQTIPDAGAVFHTHSVFATLASLLPPDGQGLTLPAVEMLKGLGHWTGHAAVLPVIPNLPHIPELAEATARAADPDVPAVLVRGHGLYAWGPDRPRARRHVESLEFLFEFIIRARALGL